jgi:spore coat protein U-like protein
MKTRRLVTAAIAAASLFAFSPVNAAPPGGVLQGQGTLNVSTSVVGACTVSANNNLTFPAYDVTNGTDDTQSTSFQVICPLGSTYSIGLDAGGHPTGAQRAMISSSGSYLLNYNLYQDAAQTTPWDDSASVESGLSGSGAAQSYTVYGQIPALQVVGVDTYSDTVTINVYF